MPEPAVNLFGFAYWPFSVVPDSTEDLVWADRSALRQQVRRLGRTLSRHDAASLHLLWADFGAGKTHTLYYLRQQALAGELGAVLPLYCALPKGCRSFLDIYRSIVRAIPLELLRTSYQTAVARVGRQQLSDSISEVWANLPRCFSVLGIGSQDQEAVALAWLQAETGIPARQLQALSLHGRIQSTDDAVSALCGLVRLFNLAGHARVLIMIDEFQRVEVLRRQQQDDINAGLHGFFNACSSGMSLLLSFSFGVEDNIRHFLNPELLSRVHPVRLSVPKMTVDDANEFLTDVISACLITKDDLARYTSLIPCITQAVAAGFEPTPRRLLKAAGLVFETAELDLEDRIITSLEPTYIEELVRRGDFLRIDDPGSTD